VRNAESFFDYDDHIFSFMRKKAASYISK